MSNPACRNCGAPLHHVFADLGDTPLANSYIPPDRVDEPEPSFPLKAFVCDACFLVQLEEFEAPEGIFSDYAYFSSWSTSWLDHCERFASEIVERLNLGTESKVVEIASNDGYLLRFFNDKGIPVLGVEPAANVAEKAKALGIPTEVDFFGTDLAASLAGEHAADLLIGNNVLAHVPDLHDFVRGMAVLLKETGTITMEFPHLLRLIEDVQFDTIYHEHFSYFSLRSACDVFARNGLQIHAVEELPTHGGSLRIYARHDRGHDVDDSIERVLDEETTAGLRELDTYLRFNQQAHAERRHIVETIDGILESGETIGAYGAPAKGNTLLNFCGIGTERIPFTVDANPVKQGKYLPGSRIPIHAPDELRARQPDRIWILPWNIAGEIRSQLSDVSTWGGRFLVRAPGSGLEG